MNAMRERERSRSRERERSRSRERSVNSLVDKGGTEGLKDGKREEVQSSKDGLHEAEGSSNERPLIPRVEDWMTNGKMKGGDAKPIRSYKEACTKVDDKMIDTNEEDEEWWRNEGWRRISPLIGLRKFLISLSTVEIKISPLI